MAKKINLLWLLASILLIKLNVILAETTNCGRDLYLERNIIAYREEAYNRQPKYIISERDEDVRGSNRVIDTNDMGRLYREDSSKNNEHIRNSDNRIRSSHLSDINLDSKGSISTREINNQRTVSRGNNEQSQEFINEMNDARRNAIDSRIQRERKESVRNGRETTTSYTINRELQRENRNTRQEVRENSCKSKHGSQRAGKEERGESTDYRSDVSENRLESRRVTELSRDNYIESRREREDLQKYTEELRNHRMESERELTEGQENLRRDSSERREVNVMIRRENLQRGSDGTTQRSRDDVDTRRQYERNNMNSRRYVRETEEDREDISLHRREGKRDDLTESRQATRIIYRTDSRRSDKKVERETREDITPVDSQRAVQRLQDEKLQSRHERVELKQQNIETQRSVTNSDRGQRDDQSFYNLRRIDERAPNDELQVRRELKDIETQMLVRESERHREDKSRRFEGENNERNLNDHRERSEIFTQQRNRRLDEIREDFHRVQINERNFMHTERNLNYKPTQTSNVITKTTFILLQTSLIGAVLLKSLSQCSKMPNLFASSADGISQIIGF